MTSDGRIFVCADIHGNRASVANIINQIDNPTENDVIIVAGDAGFEYGNYSMGSAKRATRKFPGKWIVMRGNHDNCYVSDHLNPVTGKPVEGWDVLVEGQDEYLFQKRYPNILYINDNGGIYTIKGYNFLFLPGAYSVDKDFRLRNNWPYNPNEQLTLSVQDELEELVKNWNKTFPIDYVIGHTFPKWLEPYYSDLFMSNIDQFSVDKTTEMWLGGMSCIFETNPYFKQYFGGHFHDERVLTKYYTMVYNTPVEIL